MATNSAPTCKVVLSKNVANGLLAEVQEGVKTLEKPPHLVGFLANNDPAALMYAQWTEKTCQEKCASSLLSVSKLPNLTVPSLPLQRIQIHPPRNLPRRN